MNPGLEIRRLGFSNQLYCNLLCDLEQIPWPLCVSVFWVCGGGRGGAGGELEGLQGPWDSENDTDLVGDYHAVLSSLLLGVKKGRKEWRGTE